MPACRGGRRSKILKYMRTMGDDFLRQTMGLRQRDLTDEVLVETLRRRTKRVSVAPWLWHLGLVEFSRSAHSHHGREVRRIFDLLRIRDAVLLAGAYSLIPSELLGVLGLLTDAAAVKRLTRHIDPATLAMDRSLGAFPMAAAWALSFNSPRARGPVAALLPGTAHALFAWSHKLPRNVASTAVMREAIWGAAFLYIVAELSTSIRKAITQELLAIQGTRRSTEIAANRRSKARLWLMGTHIRLNALAAARWAAEEARGQPGPTKFIELTSAEEDRLRQMFERRTVDIERLTARIRATRAIRDLSTMFVMDDSKGVQLHEDTESVADWLVEALCAFADGNLIVEIRIEGETAVIGLEADWFPRELMPPFNFTKAQRRHERIEGQLKLASTIGRS